MLYDVESISNLTKVSKVTIYSKLKLKNVKPYIVKKQGKAYVDEEGLRLIKESLNIDKNTEAEIDESLSYASIEEQLINLNKDLINSLKSEVDFLRLELQEKNKQLENKDNLLENMQVLIKQEQNKQSQENILMLEEHFNELDNRLMDIRERMGTDQDKSKGFINRLFKRSN